MRFARPRSVEAAVALLAREGARPLAGGATLVGLMNAGRVAPAHIVSLRGIPALKDIVALKDGAMLIGAMCSHATVMREKRLVGGQFVVREAASEIAHPAIKNMATLGGSLAFGDSDADYPAACVAAQAQICIAGPSGPRQVPADGFFLGYLSTALQTGELITGVLLPASSPSETSAHLRFSRVDGDYPTLSIAVRADWHGDVCASLCIAIGSCGPIPLRLPQAEALLAGTTLAPDAVREAAELFVEAAEPVGDFRGSAAYRKMLIPGLFARVLETVKQRRSHRHD